MTNNNGALWVLLGNGLYASSKRAVSEIFLRVDYSISFLNDY